MKKRTVLLTFAACIMAFSMTACGTEKTTFKLDESEIVSYMTFTYEEVLELVNLGYIKGCNSLLALEKAKTYIKK